MNMGRHSYGNPHVYSFRNDATLTIGKFCALADCFIFLGGEHNTDWISTFPFFDLVGAGHAEGHPKTKGDVVIGNDVWIGHHATIMSGVAICDGACIGTMSVVTKDVPAYTIVAGNPARVIRQRFNDKDVEFLLSLCWWDWSDDRIKLIAPVLMSGDIGALRRFANEA